MAFTLSVPATLSPSTRLFADTLKVLLAGHVAGTPIKETKGDVFALTFGDQSLTDGAAAARYILGKPAFDGSLEAILESVVIEKEQTLVPFLNKKKYTEALVAANDIVSRYAVFSNTETLGLVDVIYLASLQEAWGAFNPEQTPALANWYNTVSRSSAWAATLEFANKFHSSKKKNVPAAASKAASVPAAKVCEMNPETQKINQGIELKLATEGEKVQPKKGERNILITSALPYVNNIPHLGNIVGSTLSADVFARYCRCRGYNTLYICGTDEYGTATETKALEEGVSCQELCDKYNAVHASVYKWFQISFDHFGRTTTQKQTEIAQDIFRKAHANGYLHEETVTQLFCEQCQRFLADRYVEGTCPKCGYDDARGDQCDKCGHLLNAVELINPRCKLDNNQPITKDSRHIFLDLDRLQGQIEAYVSRATKEGKWSNNGIHITESWLKEGLRPRCITRDLKWGVPVPMKGFEDKVFYVWYDAPIGYPSITANYTEEWESWWKNPDNVKLYQFMGKDNVPFHSVIFPGCELATQEAWTMVHHISTTEYLNYEGGKFSKSRNIGVFGTNAQETGIPVSVWRYYLLSGRPEASDAMFTWDEFIAKNNNELLNNLGNFVNRTVKFVMSKYDGVVPPADPAIIAELPVMADVNELLAQYTTLLEEVKLRAGLHSAMAVSSRGNQFLQESNLSNTLFAEDRARCDTVVHVAVNLIYLLSVLIYPYIPDTSESISRQLNAPLRTLPDTFSLDILAGHRLNGAEYLFTRIDEKMASVWRDKYFGV